MTRARPTLQHDAQLVAIDSLKPYPGNARTHDLDVIRESLRLNGQYRPLVVRSRTRHVLAGNGTLRAARAEGYSEIWATFVDVDAPTGKRINLVDNVSNDKAGWDEELLAAQLGSLPSVEGTGYTESELVSFMAQVNGPAEDTEPSEPPVEPKTKPGDLWVLGEHRLLCGDATDTQHADRLIESAPSCLLTDPPYSSGGHQDGLKRNSTSIGARGSEQIARDNLTSRGYLALIGRVLGAVDAEVAYVFTDWRMWSWTFDVLESSGYPVRGMLVWDKEQMGMGFPWRSQHELIAFAKRTAGVINDGKHGNVLRCPRTTNDLHPTQKPVDLLEVILGNTPGEDCYDPFAGSGSTLIACENLSRRCYAMEIDPGYCDVIVDRFERHTGQSARLAPKD